MKKYLWLLFMVCCGCGLKKAPSALNASVVNTHTVIISFGDKNQLSDFKQDAFSNESWQKLLPVYKMPADTDMKDFQEPQPGKYLLRDNAVVFTPDTPLVKGQRYFVRLYQFADQESAFDILKTRWKGRRPQYAEKTFRP
ncbi:hypothetical protein MUY27_19695 [Mucilaginibacter sp. RS28]|uniref:Uncharacterized protein n=1 Tax=Mucilaginibacter straminoryzae TaxID=2932774 RepID=A0A9X2BDD7_9SPHI|nr:hypothetical protein [Mucilaginibacter straminoryzae]MCJ8211952.1 hypothetical protein [Mucilaginibacter straminoryzae]